MRVEVLRAADEPDARAELVHRVRVERLVGEERHDDGRDAGGQRAERRAGASVVDHRGGVGHDLRLRDPALDVDALRQRSELGRIGLLAHGDEHAQRQVGDRVDHRAVEVRIGALGGRDSAEGDRHERIGRAVPPVGQRSADGADRRAVSVHAGRGLARGVEDGGRLGEDRRLLRAGRVRVGVQAEVRAQIVERLGRDGKEHVLVGGGEADADANVGHTVLLRGDQRGELARLAQDDVGPPALDEVQHRRERGAGVGADEELRGRRAEAVLVGRRALDQLADVPVALGRSERNEVERERVARGLDPDGLGPGDEHLVPGVVRGEDEGQEGAEVTGTAGAGDEDLHRFLFGRGLGAVRWWPMGAHWPVTWVTEEPVGAGQLTRRSSRRSPCG